MYKRAGSIVSLFMAVVALLLSGCEDPRIEALKVEKERASDTVELLQKQLENGKIRNAVLLSEYSKIAKQERPELSSVIDALSREGTTKGPRFESLQRRLAQNNESPERVGDIEAQLSEYRSISTGATPYIFGNSLADPINVMADLSQGKLARIDAPSLKEEKKVNGTDEDLGAGAQLVGNPTYGHWRTDSSGVSFWEWYGMYAMFSNFTRGPVTYADWNTHRPYSYYNDHGRDLYGTYKEKASKFAPKTRKFSSEKVKKTFAAKKKKASSYSKSTNKGSYASTQKRSSYSGSARSKSTRSIRFGK